MNFAKFMDWVAKVILPAGPIEVDGEEMERLKAEYEKLAKEDKE